MLHSIFLHMAGRGLVLFAVVLGISFSLGSRVGGAEENRPENGQSGFKTQATHSGQLPAGSKGMKAYIDPETGTFKNPPVGVPSIKPPPDHSHAFSTSARGLTQRQNPTQGGGVMVHLEGRFMTPLTATLSPTGKLTIQHLSPHTATLPEKE